MSTGTFALMRLHLTRTPALQAVDAGPDEGLVGVTPVLLAVAFTLTLAVTGLGAWALVVLSSMVPSNRRPAWCDAVDRPKRPRRLRRPLVGSPSVHDGLGPRLPDAILARRTELPDRPAAVVLTGERIRVRPVTNADHEELHAISDGRAVSRLGRSVEAYDPAELIWRYMPIGPFADATEMGAFVVGFGAVAGTRVFVVEDRVTSELVGSLSYLSNEPQNLKIEIGAVWFTPAVQGTGVYAEATRLLVTHAFGLGYQRVQWKTHSGNVRSRGAALRLGFTFEGIQDAHMILKGTRRDTAWYRVLAEEWPPAEPEPGPS